MSVFEFSRLPAYRREGSPERLLRAAVHAFCSLPRPTRREIDQLDDLAMPLIERASPETRRYVAAALSECREAPSAVVRRLSEEPVEVSAPLLMRSRELGDIDLITLIGRHGMRHARAIARRRDLNPRIAELIARLEEIDRAAAKPEEPRRDAAEETRDKLRAMMAADIRREPAAERRPPASDARWRSAPGVFDRLRSTALSGVRELFTQTLARSLGLGAEQARALASPRGHSDFALAMRALGLSAEQAFLLAACVFGSHFAHPEAIRLFLDRFASQSPEAARATVRDWKMSAFPGAPAEDEDMGETAIPAPANEVGAATALLKVS